MFDLIVVRNLIYDFFSWFSIMQYRDDDKPKCSFDTSTTLTDYAVKCIPKQVTCTY